MKTKMPSSSGEATAFAATLAVGLSDTVAVDDSSASAPTVIKGTPERYAVKGMLGEGGMGRVLEATDLWFGRSVALKELRSEIASTGLMRRFLVEALVTANLEHPGIVPVYERGVREGRPYYVMRKLHGRTLADALNEARTFKQRLLLVPALVRVAQTIAFAHERGVIHRDLKPENIVLGTHGEVTVIDWGIARVRDLDGLGLDASQPSDPTMEKSDTVGKTVVGSLLGTPAYMAPEQALGDTDAIDERTDVFALGALLYHVIGGHAPFEGTTIQGQIAKAINVEYPDLASVAPKAPAPLTALVARAMSKAADARFRSAGDLAEALEDALTLGLAGSESRVLQGFGFLISAISIVFAVVGSVLAWRVIPSFHEMGWGAYPLVLLATLGVTCSVVEGITKGRYHLGSLALAFMGMTFISGMMGMTSGLFNLLSMLQAPEFVSNAASSRAFALDGAHGALGLMMAGGALAGGQLLLWGVFRRRVARATAQVSRG